MVCTIVYFHGKLFLWECSVFELDKQTDIGTDRHHKQTSSQTKKFVTIFDHTYRRCKPISNLDKYPKVLRGNSECVYTNGLRSCQIILRQPIIASSSKMGILGYKCYYSWFMCLSEDQPPSGANSLSDNKSVGTAWWTSCSKFLWLIRLVKHILAEGRHVLIRKSKTLSVYLKNQKLNSIFRNFVVSFVLVPKWKTVVNCDKIDLEVWNFSRSENLQTSTLGMAYVLHFAWTTCPVWCVYPQQTWEKNMLVGFSWWFGFGANRFKRSWFVTWFSFDGLVQSFQTCPSQSKL